METRREKWRHREGAWLQILMQAPYESFFLAFVRRFVVSAATFRPSLVRLRREFLIIGPLYIAIITYLLTYSLTYTTLCSSTLRRPWRCMVRRWKLGVTIDRDHHRSWRKRRNVGKKSKFWDKQGNSMGWVGLSLVGRLVYHYYCEDRTVYCRFRLTACNTTLALRRLRL